MAKSAWFRRLRTLASRRTRYRLTGGGILFFLALSLVGAAAFLTANNLLFLMFSAMLSTLLVSGFLSRLMLSGLEVELLLPEHVWARTPAPARVRVRNLKRFTPSFALELSGERSPLADAPPILTQPVYFPLIPGKTTVEAAVDVTFPRRGRHKENVFLIATRFPFGFLRKTASLALERETIVYPAPEPFPEAGGLLERARHGQREAAFRGSGRDFHGLRPWQYGDSARHVDWKSSARTGERWVREFAREDDDFVQILLDRRVAAGSGAVFDRITEQCAWLVSHLGSEGIPLSLSSQGYHQASGSSGGNVDDFYALLRYLALAEPLIAVTSKWSPESPKGASDGGIQVVFSAHPAEFQNGPWGGALLIAAAVTTVSPHEI